MQERHAQFDKNTGQPRIYYAITIAKVNIKQKCCMLLR